MSNTLIIEANMLFNEVRSFEHPKEVLNMLAEKKEALMGWHDITQVRALTWAVWLNELRMQVIRGWGL